MNPETSRPDGDAESPSHSRRHWYLVASLLIAVVLLGLAFRSVKWRELGQTVRQARVGWLVLAGGVSSGTYFIRAVRWRVLLSAEKRVPALTVFWANMAGYLGNSFLPARAGEVIRSVALGTRANLSRSFVLATALTERVLDAIALLVISLIAVIGDGNTMPNRVPSVAASARPLLGAFRVIGIVGVAGLLLIIIAPALENGIRKLILRLPLPERVRRRLSEMLARFLLGMRTFRNPQRIVLFGLLTIAIWLGDGLGTIAGARALHLALTLPQALILLAGLGLSSAVPLTPGYIGVYQFVAVTILVPFGFSRSQALAYILVAQAFGYVIVTVWGLLGLWRLNMRRTRGTAGTGRTADSEPEEPQIAQITQIDLRSRDLPESAKSAVKVRSGAKSAVGVGRPDD